MLVGLPKSRCSSGDLLVDETVVHVVRGKYGQAAVVVLLVVPVDEVDDESRERPQYSEVTGEVRPALERLEAGLGVRVCRSTGTGASASW